MYMRFFILTGFILWLSCNTLDSFRSRYLKFFNDTEAEELAYAVYREDTTEIKEILDAKSTDVNFQEEQYGYSVLMIAVIENKINSVKVLLEHGADPNLQNKRNINSVILACNSIYHVGECPDEILHLLLKHGGDPNSIWYFEEKTENGGGAIMNTTPLMEASGAGCINQINLLLNFGANINTYTLHEGYGAISESIILDQLKVTRYLIIEKKAKIPKYCYITFDPDTLTVEDLLNRQEYKSNLPEDIENEVYRKEIIEYLHTNVDSLGNHKN